MPLSSSCPVGCPRCWAALPSTFFLRSFTVTTGYLRTCTDRTLKTCQVCVWERHRKKLKVCARLDSNPQYWLIPRLCFNLLFMANRTPYKAITRGIAVSVEPTYLEADSSPSNSQYLWAYRVLIENQGRETVQLLSRHWMITNARGELIEVKGPGVIGKQPFLRPGESHAYTSGTPLNTPWGMMGGSYQMESESGERFDIEIPTFSLDSPNQGVLLH